VKRRKRRKRKRRRKRRKRKKRKKKRKMRSQGISQIGVALVAGARPRRSGGRTAPG
jgi:hypothetical protein